MDKEETLKYLEFAKRLADKAGGIMLKHFHVDVETRTKADKTIVTIADEEVNRMVIEEVAKAFSSHSVLGEEQSVDKQSKYIWVCDPVDGTTPYAKGIPVAVFSLALVVEGTPLVGVVSDPFTKRLYSATKDGGAFLNGEPLKVSSVGLGESATINIEWWSNAPYDVDTAMHGLSLETSTYVLHMGCVVQAACLVASGQYEACVYAGTKGKNVDVAAVKLIVEEAGGVVTDIKGNEQRYDRDINGAIISNKEVHSKLVEKLKNL